MNIRKTILIFAAALLVCSAPLFQVTSVFAAQPDAAPGQGVSVNAPPPPPPFPPLPPPPPPPPPPVPPPDVYHPPFPPAPPMPPHPPAPYYPPVPPPPPQPIYPHWDVPCYFGCPPCPSTWKCTNYPWTKVVIVEAAPRPVICTPVIESFTAVPSCVQPCSDVTLLWTVTNADMVTISPGIGTISNTGSYRVTVAATTTFTLSASNGAGSVIASTTVTVNPVITSSSTSINSAVISNSSAAGTTTDTAGLVTMGLGGNTGPFSSWLLYILLFVVLAAATAAIIAFARKPAAAYAGHRGGTRTGFVPWSTATLDATDTPKTTTIEAGSGAKFVTSGGERIAIPGYGTFLGRNDFRSMLVSNKADLISREHVRVEVDHGDYYIEDRNSTNDTKVNGSRIKGKGRLLLRDGDVVELANVLTLTFRM